MKVKPFTFEQYEKWIQDNFGGWGDALEGDTDGETTAEDAAGDMGDTARFIPGYSQAVAYLRQEGVTDITDIKGRMTDDIYNVASE